MSNKPSRLKVWFWAMLHHEDFQHFKFLDISCSRIWDRWGFGLDIEIYPLHITDNAWEDYANAHGIDIYA